MLDAIGEYLYWFLDAIHPKFAVLGREKVAQSLLCVWMHLFLHNTPLRVVKLKA